MNSAVLSVVFVMALTVIGDAPEKIGTPLSIELRTIVNLNPKISKTIGLETPFVSQSEEQQPTRVVHKPRDPSIREDSGIIDKHD